MFVVFNPRKVISCLPIIDIRKKGRKMRSSRSIGARLFMYAAIAVLIGVLLLILMVYLFGVPLGGTNFQEDTERWITIVPQEEIPDGSLFITLNESELNSFPEISEAIDHYMETGSSDFPVNPARADEIAHFINTKCSGSGYENCFVGVVRGETILIIVVN